MTRENPQIRCLIVDDEQVARDHMARLLLKHPDCIITGKASDAIEALQSIADSRPDVIFLDIEMPEVSGFDMLAQVAHPPLVVFATAYDKYAVDAFDANAIDYILKPIQPARLAKAIQKVRSMLARPHEEYESMLRRALSELRRGAPAKLAARRGKRIVLLSPREIFYVRVEDEIVFVHSQNERFATERTIGELEEFLTPAGFCRINRSTIINLAHARELVPWSSGTWRVRLSNNAELEVSRERARKLRSSIG